MTHDAEPEPLVLRAVTVAEVFTEDATALVITTEGQPELWTILGMLKAGVLSVEADLNQTWFMAEDEDED